MSSNSENQLVVIDDPRAVYKQSENIDKLLAEIRESALAFSPDVSKASDRKKTISIASKVASLKVFLDSTGKELGADLKKELDCILADRKKIRDTLDDLKIEVRQPVTDWEDQKKAIDAELAKALDDFDKCARSNDVTGNPVDSDTLRQAVEYVQAMRLKLDHPKKNIESFSAAKSKTIDQLCELINKAVIREKEAEELRILREKEEKRLKEEETRRIQEEAAERERERLRKQAEEDKRREESERAKEKAEAEKRIKDAEERAEREKAAAQQAAKDAETRAVKAAAEERQKIEAAAAAERQEAEQRAANQAHRSQVLNRVYQNILSLDIPSLDESNLVPLLKAVADGNLHPLKIEF